MKLRLFSTAVAVLLCSASAAASVPSDQMAKQRLMLKLDALIKQPENGSEIVRTATLLATPAQLAAVCENPTLSRWDATAVSPANAPCSRSAARAAISCRYASARRVPVGGKPEPARRGDCATQRYRAGHRQSRPPAGGLIFNADEIIGQRLTRAVDAGKPLLENQLRQQWRLRAGQTVDRSPPGQAFVFAAARR